MPSALESATFAAGQVLWASAFGEELRSFHTNQPTGSPPSVFEMEIIRRPFMQTALAVVALAERTHIQLGAPQRQAAYFDFIRRAMRVLEAFADKCWGAVPPDVRALFPDEDDLPLSPFTSSYFPLRRSAHPPRFRSIQGLRLVDREASTLAQVWRQMHQTQVYSRALAACDRIRSDNRMRQTCRSLKQRLTAGINPVAGEYATQESRRLRETLDELYRNPGDGAVQACADLRAFHQLVQRIVWSLVSFSGEPLAPEAIDWEIGRVPITRTRRRLEAHFTITDPRFLIWSHPTDALFVTLNTPADGLYNALSTGFRWERHGAIVVIRAERIKEFEG